MAVAGLIGAMCWAAPSAEAFLIQNHASLTRTALPSDQVNEVDVWADGLEDGVPVEPGSEEDVAVAETPGASTPTASPTATPAP